MNRPSAGTARPRIQFLWWSQPTSSDSDNTVSGLLIVVVQPPLPPGCHVAAIAGLSGGSTGERTCIGLQPAGGRGFVMFRAPAANDFVAEAIILPENGPAERSETVTFRHPQGSEQQVDRDAFDFDLRTLEMRPASRGKAPPAGVFRLYGRGLEGEGPGSPVVAPTSDRPTTEKTSLRLEVIPPQLDNAWRTANTHIEDFHGGVAPTPMRLKLKWRPGSGQGRPARVGYANRQRLGTRRLGRRRLVDEANSAAFFWLKGIPPDRPRNGCSFEVPATAPGDILIVCPATGGGSIELCWRHEITTLAIDRYLVLVVDRDYRLLECDPVSFEPAGGRRESFHEMPGAVARELRVAIERALRDPGRAREIDEALGHLEAEHPDAAREGRLADVARAARKPQDFFFLAERLTEVFERATSKAARERLRALLSGTDSTFVARLVSPAVTAFADNPVELARLADATRGNLDFSQADDALEPYFDALARAWEPDDWVAEGSAIEPRTWFEGAPPEARIALSRLMMKGAAAADTARRLVHAGLLPLLDDRAPETIETDLAFAERYLTRRRQDLPVAVRDALRWANADALRRGVAGAADIAVRLGVPQGVPAEAAPTAYLDLPTLRTWRNETNVDALLAQMTELRSRLMRDYEAGRTSLRHVPPFSWDGVDGADRAAELQRAARGISSPEMRALVEKARDWQPASRAALTVTLRAVSAAANWKLPHEPGMRLDPSVRGSIDGRALSFACELNEIVETYTGAVRFIYDASAPAADGFEKALRKRATSNAAVVARSLRQLAGLIGHEAAGASQMIEANARAVAALDLKARLDRFVDRTASKLKRGLDNLHIALKTSRSPAQPTMRQEATALAIQYIEEILPNLDTLRLKNLISKQIKIETKIGMVRKFWKALLKLRNTAAS